MVFRIARTTVTGNFCFGHVKSYSKLFLRSPARGKIVSGAYALVTFFARSPPFGSYRTKNCACGLHLPLRIPPRSRRTTLQKRVYRRYVKPKQISKMKTTKFEIAVAGYAYRFKTYARDGVEASVKVKCFLGQPNAECTILTPALNDSYQQSLLALFQFDVEQFGGRAYDVESTRFGRRPHQIGMTAGFSLSARAGSLRAIKTVSDIGERSSVARTVHCPSVGFP